MTVSKPKDLAASVRQRLLNHARKVNVDFQVVLAQFGFERLLYRLSRSKYAGQFTVKGALMFLVWTGEQYRPTVDLDLAAAQKRSGKELKTIFQDICSLAVEDDGLVFLSVPVHAESIRADTEYGGMRVTMEARLGQAIIPLQVDICCGDAITPKARIEEFPTLLDFPAPQLPMYPKETSIAEKYETMVRRGIINSRMKDYYDVWVMAGQFAYDGETLKSAIRATFLRRKTVLPEEVPEGLSDEFITDKTKQNQWYAFIRRTRLKLPCESLNIIVTELRKFLVPPSMAACRSKTFDKTWRKGGPWQ